ncbi:MAG: restriction endonuclease subunit R, partial [Actinobacteria bacterium]|nr:restriction endonuclease subunit R [Actinomycetota bacterium]
MPVDDLEQVIAATEAEVAELAAQGAAAAERLAALRQRRSRTSSGSGDPVVATSSDWSPMRKVELFRSLFRGREEMFAVRWENAAKQKAGYAPNCANEWKHGVCEKPRVRCGA